MTERNAAEVAVETLGHDMLEGIINEVRQLPGWSNLTSHQQGVHIDRIDKRIRKLVTDALDIIFKGQYPACVAELSTVSFGKNIKAKIEIAKTAQARHELADAAGQTVVIVMADPDQFFERMKEIQASADQRDLFHDPKEPLGHMGKDTPPDEPSGGAGSLFENDGTALDDALPPSDAGDDVVGMLPSHEDVCAALVDCGLRCEVWPTWPEEELRTAYVWAIAAKQFKADGRDPPEVPEFLRQFIPIPEVEIIESPPTDPTVAEPSKPPPLPPAGDDDEAMVANLEFRGIYVSLKIVKRWGKVQRMAAVAWLSGRAAERPDFLPLPKVPAPGLKDDQEAP